MPCLPAFQSNRDLTPTYTGRGFQITQACFRRIICFIFRGSTEEDDGRRLVAGRYADNYEKKGNRDSRVDLFSEVKAVVGKEPSATVEGTRQRKIVVRM